MASTNLTDLQNQVEKLWVPMWEGSLQESASPLLALTQAAYQNAAGGTEMARGDTVYISRISKLTAQDKAVSDSDADHIDAEKIETSRIAVVADRQASMSLEFSSLAELQSQLNSNGDKIREEMFAAVMRKMSQHVWTKIAPSASAPDHDLGSVTDFNAAQFSAVRTLAAQQFWGDSKWLLLDPQYYSDVLDDTTLASSDYTGDDAPMVSGRVARQRFGFNVIEDESIGSATGPSGVTSDYGLAFTPDFLYTVVQQAPTFRVIDNAPRGVRTFTLDLKVVYGCKLAHQGALKHIRIQGS